MDSRTSFLRPGKLPSRGIERKLACLGRDCEVRCRNTPGSFECVCSACSASESRISAKLLTTLVNPKLAQMVERRQSPKSFFWLYMICVGCPRHREMSVLFARRLTCCSFQDTNACRVIFRSGSVHVSLTFEFYYVQHITAMSQLTWGIAKVGSCQTLVATKEPIFLHFL